MKNEKKLWEIDKQMLRHRVTNPFELTEFDQWVNDATRKDINSLVERGEVFGLKFWSWKIVEGEQLKDAKNFEIDLVFRKKDMDRVKQIIEDYESSKKENGATYDLQRSVIDKLFDLAIYTAMWV